MKIQKHLLKQASIALTTLLLAACGGGGGGSSADAGGGSVTPNEVPGEGRMLSYTADIEPIVQGKCQGCHNGDDNALAPISFADSDVVHSFKSAIQYSLESSTMPPVGAPQLTATESSKIMAWLTDTPYVSSGVKVRVSLVEAQAWDITSRNRDNLLDHRPAQIECPRGTGWLIEEDAIEIRTAFCNYLSLTQQTLLNLEAGTTLELALSHSALDFNAPSTAHWAVAIAGTTVWEKEIPIPSEGQILKESLELPFAVSAGDDIVVHLHNHGNNAWTVHSIDALVPEETELQFCESYENTWDAIQAVVIEKTGCANSLCHGEAAAGVSI